MKTLTAFHKIILLFAIVILPFSCSNDDDMQVVIPQPETISEIADATPELSSLVAALEKTNLLATLDAQGSFTVFAPTNIAFDNFLSGLGLSLDTVDEATLTQILLNHVISGELQSTDLSTSYQKTLATQATTGENLSLFVDTSSGVMLNATSSVTQPDIDATNGVIHIVDAVIPPPSIVDHALANPNLTSLVTALTSFGTTFTELLSTPGDFTVFAPINDAFTNFTNPDNNALDAILSNHVIVGATAVSSGLSNSYVKTAATYADTNNNLSLYINTDDGVSLNGTSNVIIPDIIATNGVIHAVDMVIDIPTITSFAVADPDFSTLKSALTELTPATDFASILSRTSNGNSDSIDPPFTVFAPTNDAFAALTAIPEESVLTQVLLHHVVGGLNVTSSDLVSGDNPAPTLQGSNITITLPGTDSNIADITDGAGNTDIGIIKVDVQAGNGVIHVVDKVLLP